MKNPFLLLFNMLVIGNAFSQDQGFQNHLSGYIENTAVFQQGQEEARAYYIPEGHLSLNGQWKFFYSDTPEGIPAGFFEAGFDDRAWKEIAVPSNWEMQGYGDKLFRNISTTFTIGRPANAPPDRWGSSGGATNRAGFAVIPPEVPDEYNPTGAYRKTVTLPRDWDGKEVFLRFEKVASASFVWVNGREVGYNEGAQEPSEYNITSFLQPGENTIAVLVLKFSDGYYLEGQDYWRLAGIFDDVWVYATPPVRLFDWQVVTDLDERYEHADLSVEVAVKSYRSGGRFRVHTVLNRNGRQVFASTSQTFTIGRQARETVSFSEKITSPDKWTSESPDLYGLSIELLGDRGEVVDGIQTRIGFKETEIKGNTFYLNGVPLKIHGINSHMQHPELGHVMDEATIRKDFEILKRFNFNAVRTSHYPPVNKYLELANEYGLYIIDEAGTEAHASEYMSEMPEYTDMYLDRVRAMVLRDRNQPCVLFWSAGNESGEGENITKVVREGKRLDPTRYWMYGGNADVHPGEDIIGPRYPSPIELEINIGLGTDDQRPSFMDEYLSIAGNGGGGLDDYWRVIYNHPRLLGGAIWDFVSPGLTEPVRRLDDRSPFNTPAHIMGKAALVEAKDGKALDLNGHDQWVEIYRSDNVEVVGDQLMITMDVFPRKLNSSAGAFITKGNYQFGVVQNGKDSIDFYIYTGKKQVLTSALPANWENHWHQVTAVYDGRRMRLLIDGKETAAQEAGGVIQNLPFPINVGRNAEAHGQDTDVYICDALIDNIGIFTRVMDLVQGLDPADATLWLDFENEVNEGTFNSYGIGARTYGAIWPDRTPQPEMWQMKKSVQPLSFKLVDVENGEVEVWNRSNYTNASHWATTWTLTEDETVLQSGKLDLDVGPQNRFVVTLPFSKPVIIPGKAYRLNISSALKSGELWAPEGFEISWDQFELANWNLPESQKTASGLPVNLTSDPEAYIISGEGFAYRFDKKSGALRSMVVNGNEMLEAPLKLNVWRAPVANEIDHWNGLTMRTSRWKEGFGTTIATDYYSNGIHDLKYEPLEVIVREGEDMVYVNVRELALVNGGSTNYTIMDRYTTGLTLSGFESIYEYAVSGDGSIAIDHVVMPQGSMPQMLPRIGLTLMMDEQFDQLEWYGRGPQENYPDRKSGYRLGIYQASARDLYEPYLIPQDHGLRTDNRWLKMTDDKGRGLAFSMNEPFNFNAYPFSTENLTRALYTYQLQEAGGTTLNLDYNTTGVGGTARPVFDAYRVYPQSYSRQILIELLK